jgi:hypothetical protein
MSLATFIRTAIQAHPGEPASDIAEIIAKTLSTDDLVSLLEMEIEHQLRNGAREIERGAQLKDLMARFEGATASDSPRASHAFKLLLTTPFKLGDGSPEATWGTATIAQHRQRMALLDLQIQGLITTRDRHATAIEMIEAAGVKCLNDLA